MELRENNPYVNGSIEYLNDSPHYSLNREVVVFSKSENDQLYVVTEGETLGMITFEVYSDSKWWWILADANNLAKDSLSILMNLEPGLILNVPDLIKYRALS